MGSFDGVDVWSDTPARREFDSRTLHPQQQLRSRKNGDRLVWYRTMRHQGRSVSGPRHFAARRYQDRA